MCSRFLAALTLSLCLFFAENAFACPDIDGLVDVNCDGKLVIYTFGDSITYGLHDNLTDSTGRALGYPGRMQLSSFPHAVIRNAGKPGETSAAGVVRAAMVVPDNMDVDYFVLLEGVNDYYVPHHFSPTTKSNLLQIFRTGRNTGALALLANLTDVKRSFQKAWVVSVNDEINPLRQVDFFSLGTRIIGGDGVHPTGVGYQAMAGTLATTLKQFSLAHRPVDTDGDGLYDFEEARLGTNPNVADTDGDGIPDGVEVWTYHSNPQSLDSDGDGIPDSTEVFTLHSDPANPLPGAPKVTDLVAVAQ